MEACVLSFVHHSHPTTAQLLDDAVVRDGLTDHSQKCYGGWRCMSMNSGVATSASRTPPWLASGRGCRGRRLSTGQRSLRKRFALWLGPRSLHRRDRVGDGPAPRWVDSARCPVYRGSSETQWKLSCPDAQLDRLLRAHNRDTTRSNYSQLEPLAHRGWRLGESPPPVGLYSG